MDAVQRLAGKKTVEVTKDQLINDFRVVIADAEALLKATAGQGGEALAAVRTRVGDSLAVAKTKMTAAEEELVAKAKVAATAEFRCRSISWFKL